MLALLCLFSNLLFDIMFKELTVILWMLPLIRLFISTDVHHGIIRHKMLLYTMFIK